MNVLPQLYNHCQGNKPYRTVLLQRHGRGLEKTICYHGDGNNYHIYQTSRSRYPNAIVRISKHATSSPIWLDVINSVPFKKRPTIIRSGWLELTTNDNTKFYPRVVTHEMNVASYTNSDVLNAGIEDGLRFKNFYIQPSEPRKLYKYIEKSDSFLLFADEAGNLFMKEEYQLQLKPITREQWQKKKDEACKDWES